MRTSEVKRNIRRGWSIISSDRGKRWWSISWPCPRHGMPTDWWWWVSMHRSRRRANRGTLPPWRRRWRRSTGSLRARGRKITDPKTKISDDLENTRERLSDPPSSLLFRVDCHVSGRASNVLRRLFCCQANVFCSIGNLFPLRVEVCAFNCVFNNIAQPL